MRTATNTKAMSVAAAGQTGAGIKNIGTVTLPAGGPWNIVYAWALAVHATLTAAEYCGGSAIFTASSGDVTPNMSPCKIPTPLAGSVLNTTASMQFSKLSIMPLNLVASGKAVIVIDYDQFAAITVAPQVVAGLIFGNDVIESEMPANYDQVDLSVAAFAKTSIGTITIAETANKIVSITAIMANDGVLVTQQELLGFITLESDDVKIVPGQFPISGAYSAGIGATIGNPVAMAPVIIPVDIPVIGGARVDISADLNTALTNGAIINVILGYN